MSENSDNYYGEITYASVSQGNRIKIWWW